MLKKTALLLCLLLALAALAACSPSPTAVAIGKNRVDASEYAFYLNYNRLRSEEGGEPEYGEAATAAARESSLNQIITNELIRIKCRELGLELEREQKELLRENKQTLIDSLGGKAAYLEFLRESALTDRAYDKFQENSLYYELLFDHIASEYAPSDEELRRYFAENYIMVKYIRIALIDELGEPLGERDAAERLQLAEKVLALAQEEGADFDLLISEYNDDVSMADAYEGLVLSRLEAEGAEYLLPAFELAVGEVGGIYTGSDGYYIIRRLNLGAGYFEENREYILQSAENHNFSRLLEEWKGETRIKTYDIIEKIDLGNLMEYVK